MQLALLPPGNTRSQFPEDEKKILVLIPFATSGVTDHSIVVVSGYRIWIGAPNGSKWNSGWESHGQTLFPDQKSVDLSFLINKKFFERVQSGPVTARISLALTIYQDTNRKDFVTPSGEFLMSDVGFCSAQMSYTRELHCRSPLKTPSSLLITSDLSATTCPPTLNESKAQTPEIVRNWHEHSESGPAEFGLSPVKTFDLFLWSQHDSARPTISGICPGTPLVISSPVLARRTRTELKLNGLRLADYGLRGVERGSAGFGFVISR